MKTNIKYITVVFSLFMTMTSCSKFLEITPKDSQDQDSFFRTSTEAMQALIGTYELLRNDNLDWQAMPQAMTADVMSDDVYPGGANSNDMLGWQQAARFDARAVSQQGEKTWKKCYVGIQRATTLLEGYDKIEFKSNEQELKSHIEGEALFLRGHYYFEVLRLFENVPIVRETLGGDNWEDIEQATPDESYAYAAANMINAIPLMAERHVDSDLGRLTKYAAKAELVKMFLFYTGYYQKDAMPVEDHEPFTKADAIAMAEDIIQNSGASLSANYADLFNANGNFNKEVLFEICFANTGTGDWSHNKLGNYQCIMSGPRGHSSDLLAQGWGFGAPTRQLEALFEDGDTRKSSTIVYAKELLDAPNANGMEAHFNYTGMFVNKYTTHAYRYAGAGAPELNYDQNYHYIRLADVLLMAAELNLGINDAKALQYVNQVRNRAGLQPLASVDLDAIYLERRLELALEGHRYFDVLRRGLNYAKQTLDVPSYTLTPPTHDDEKYIINGVNMTGDVGVENDFIINFDASKRGFLPIPQRELDLNNKLKQNQGY
ncbi:RagB/SusD family nutrient uptake outer membrane protein [Flammeovirga sp. SubArs3]|uniref:RagB/SusD family nutrient uptake outer membrane protein n=1 Tax=Flammeovirga sp. SubArs3 TaxID=2995316 RepID=UPI00248B3A15|nr:RagB/SusD family nutrient uptake outer membrane protein [Flammeovirga sp. SubArs3]